MGANQNKVSAIIYPQAIGPYADSGPADGGLPPPPMSFHPAYGMVLPNNRPLYYDITNFAIPIGFDFRKRQIVGI